MKMIWISESAFASVFFLFTTSASAHQVFPLEGRRWAVICDNGATFTFGGSEQGAAEVADILCPQLPDSPWVASLTPSTGRGSWRDAREFVTTGASGRYVLRPEVATTWRREFRGYPPNDYPCLGCEPCPDRPQEFCEIVGIRVHPDAAAAGWVLNRTNRLVLTTCAETESRRSTERRPE